METNNQPQRYLRRSYYGTTYGACGARFKPAPGTTFSEVHPEYCPPCAEWLEPEDREASKADMAEAQKAASRMTKKLLVELLLENGLHAHTGARKSDLVCRAVLLHMRKRWPILVVA